MNYYQIYPHDQSRHIWLMCTTHRERPYLSVKPLYTDCVCSNINCKKINHEKAFEKGFLEKSGLKLKADIFGTSEGFLCFNEKTKNIVESNKFAGLDFKPIPGTCWWVVNVVRRVNADWNTFKRKMPACELCGRPKETYGSFNCINQVEAPDERGAFFSPTFDCGGGMNMDRDCFLTEDIVSCFKEQKLKGAMFQRLLTPIEYADIKAAGAEYQPDKWPKDSRVIL